MNASEMRRDFIAAKGNGVESSKLHSTWVTPMCITAVHAVTRNHSQSIRDNRYTTWLESASTALAPENLLAVTSLAADNLLRLLECGRRSDGFYLHIWDEFQTYKPT